MITAPNCKVRTTENTTKMLLIVFFPKGLVSFVEYEFTSSHLENKLTVYHDVHWALLIPMIPPEKISKGWRDDQVGE